MRNFGRERTSEEDLVERICPVCGAVFLPTSEHVYRIKNKRPVCSWACLCAWRKQRARARGNGVVLMYDKNDGHLVGEYDNAAAAARETGIDYGSIRECCAGIVKSAGGYVWRWENNKQQVQ